MTLSEDVRSSSRAILWMSIGLAVGYLFENVLWQVEPSPETAKY